MPRTRATTCAAAIVSAVLAVAAAGCGGGKSDDQSTSSRPVTLTQGRDFRFAMVTHGDAGSFWTVVKRGAQQAAKDLGIELDYEESVNDPQKQAQMIDAAISAKVDGLAVSAPNPDAIKAELLKAKAAGIPVITLNAGSSIDQQVGAIGHVGQEEEIAGRAVGARIKAAGGHKVLCVIHEQGNVSLSQRCQGVKEGLGSGGSVDNLQVKGTADVATSMTEMKSKLQADKSYDWVVTLNGEIAMAAVDAIKDASSQAKLGTFDLSGPVVKAVQNGTIQWAIDQQQYLQGYLSVVFLYLYKTNSNEVGGGMPVLTGPSFVDKTNAAAVAKLAEQGTR